MGTSVWIAGRESSRRRLTAGAGRSAEPGDVAARPTQAHDIPLFNGIAGNRHDDGKGLRRFPSRRDRSGITGDDDLDMQMNQLCRQTRKPRGVVSRVSALDDEVPALDPFQIVQALQECRACLGPY